MALAPPRLLSLLLLACLAVAAACSGDESDQSGGTPQPGETVEAEATPPAGVSVSRAPVTWTDAPVFDYTNISELPDPFAMERQSIDAREVPQGRPPIPATSGVSVVGPDGAQKQVYTTRRWLTGLTWDGSGLNAQFTTRRSMQSPAYGGVVQLDWRGSVRIDPGSGATTDSFGALPYEVPGDLQIANGKVFFIEADPTGTKLLVTVASEAVAPPLPGQVSSPKLEGVYVVAAGSGRGKRLEGLPDVTNLRWLPGGDGLLGSRSSGGNPWAEQWIVPLESGDAIHLANVAGMVLEEHFPSIGRTGKGRVLFVLNDLQAPGSTIMAIYEAGGLRFLSQSGPPPNSSPFAGLPAPPVGGYWPAGGDLVYIGGNTSVVINVTDGSIAPLGPNQPVVREPIKSPDGRYEIVVEPPPSVGQASERCLGLPYKLVVRDSRSNTEKTLLECNTSPAGAGVFWVGNTKIMARVPDCGACDSASERIYLIDVVSGEVRALNQELERFNVTAVSADATKIAIGGVRLRLFDISGNVLRDLGSPPAGYRFGALAFSPDGSTIAFSLMPEAFFRGI